MKAREHERIYEFIRVSLFVLWAFRDQFMLDSAACRLSILGWNPVQRVIRIRVQ